MMISTYLIALLAVTPIAVFIWLWRKYCKGRNQSQADIYFYITTDFFTIKSKDMAITAKPGQYSELSILPLDRKGNPAVVDGVTFSSTNTDVASVLQDPNDKLKARVTFHGVGTAQIDVSVDADLGDGERLLTDFLAVEVKPEEAVSMGLQAGEPVDLPANGTPITE